MAKLKFLTYATNVATKDLLINIGKSFHRCFNQPYLVYFSVTYRCNAKCITCLRWQNDSQHEELSFAECKEAILQLRSWIGPCSISFTGGEPFVKEDFCELLKFSNSLNICTTVSTNGIVFEQGSFDKIVKTGVDSLIFSLNSTDCTIHDYYKGQNGLHQKIVEAIQYIKKHKPKIRIGVLCLITKDTYDSLDRFAQWAKEIGVDSIDFQPILDIHPPTLTIGSPLSNSLHSLPLAQIKNLEKLDKQMDLLILKDMQAILLNLHGLQTNMQKCDGNIQTRTDFYLILFFRQ